MAKGFGESNRCCPLSRRLWSIDTVLHDIAQKTSYEVILTLGRELKESQEEKQETGGRVDETGWRDTRYAVSQNNSYLRRIQVSGSPGR